MKILFLDIDGVVNNSASTMTKIGRIHQTDEQRRAIRSLKDEFALEDEMPYGPSYLIDTINPLAVSLINRLLAKEPELRIVLSSSNRAFFCGREYNGIGFGSECHLDVLRQFMRALGFIGKPLQLIFDITPRLYVRRGLEVKHWLDQNCNCEITHHAAIDDGADFEPSDCNFVQTDARLGLTDHEYFQLTKHLVIHESIILF